jgi:hypothetical protein
VVIEEQVEVRGQAQHQVEGGHRGSKPVPFGREGNTLTLSKCSTSYLSIRKHLTGLKKGKAGKRTKMIKALLLLLVVIPL